MKPSERCSLKNYGMDCKNNQCPDLKQSVYDKAVKEYEEGVEKDTSGYGDIAGYKDHK